MNSYIENFKYAWSNNKLIAYLSNKLNIQL